MERTYSQEQTVEIAQLILTTTRKEENRATVIALVGDLGAGKTTLTQSIATLLGVREHVVSPTFVIGKFYEAKEYGFTRLVHIDAYRIESIKELIPLRWEEILEDSNALVIVEWPERINKAIPFHTHWYCISHSENTRTIKPYHENKN